MVLGVDDLEFNRDRPLVERLQLGDQEAFTELYNRHHERLYRFCLYRLGDPHEAHDVVQEAFTRAWSHAPRVKGDLRFYPWLRTIAGNLCTDVGRKRARVRPAPVVDTGMTDGGQEGIVDRVDLVLLEQAMARLPERHRRVLEMREAEELSYDQLAELTGTTIGTVESLLWRARQGLKRQFAVVRGEGLLAGLPVVGWALRRAHATHARLSARLAGADPNSAAALGGAVGSVTIGSVVAVALVVSTLGGSASGQAPAVRMVAPTVAVSTTQSLMQLAAQPLEPPGPTVGPSRAGAATPSATPAHPHATRTELTNPVQTDPAEARQEASHDPVQASVGAIVAGADPPAVVTYVSGLLSSPPVVP